MQPSSPSYHVVDRQATSAAPHPIATPFRELRRYLGLTPAQVASQLHTDPDVIIALETAAFDRLPGSAERHRIVMAYTALVGVDGTPMWTCIEQTIQAGIVNQPSSPSPPHQQPASPTAPAIVPARTWLGFAAHRLADGQLREKLRRLTSRRTATVVGLLALVGVSTQSSMLQAGAATLPAPVARLVRSANDAVLLQFAPTLDGLPWIKVADPRSRRSDKLRAIKR
jgi:Helix-turn-helix domain